MSPTAMQFVLPALFSLLAVPAMTAAAPAEPGTAGAQELSPDQATTVRQGVQATLDAYRTLGAAGQWDALLRLDADDPRFRWVANGVVEARSAADLRKYFQALSPGVRVETSYQDTEITPLSPDLAYVVTLFQTRLVDPNSKGFGFGGILTMTFLRRPDGWKILNGHSSSPVHRPG
jgi:ketosteroid isomerase-like protein